MDPTRGEVRVGGVALPRVRFASLRSRVVMVPQDGFLFDTSVAENIALARPGAGPAELDQAVADLGLGDWVATLPAGLQTRVGERGEALSVGERQLVALIRAYLADPDLLVLDEATSAVDPATEVRLQRALDAVTAAGPPSRSPTGCPPPSRPTRWSSSTGGASSSVARMRCW